MEAKHVAVGGLSVRERVQGSGLAWLPLVWCARGLDFRKPVGAGVGVVNLSQNRATYVGL